MKKVLMVFLLLMIVLAGVNTKTSYAATVKFPYTLFIDGKEVAFSSNSQPLIVNGTTLVPFRPVFEQLGLKVSWEAKSKQVIGQSNDLTIRITLGSAKALVNNSEMNMPVAASTINETTYIPLRFLAESSGGELQLYGADGNHAAWFLSKKQVELNKAVIDQDLIAMEKQLSSGADPTVGVGPVGPAIFSFTPYLNDNVEMISLFLKYGMDVNSKELFNEATILHYAVVYGRINIVKYLLDNGADPTCNHH